MPSIRRLIALFVVLAVAATVALTQQSGAKPPPPPFLADAPPAVIDEFGKLIEASHGKTDAQVDQDVDAWIKKQSADINTKFNVFKAEMKLNEDKAEAAHKAALAAFSPAAKEADAKLSAIANNPALSGQVKGQQIEALVKSLPPNVRAEIEKAMQG